jgi:hypothetical protein
MTSRVRELADFLRHDPEIACGVDVVGGGPLSDGVTDPCADPYTEAAKRILFQVHLFELPAGQRRQTSVRAGHASPGHVPERTRQGA